MPELYPGQSEIVAGKLNQIELIQQADHLRAEAETDPLKKAAILTRMAARATHIAGYRDTLAKCQTGARDEIVRLRLTEEEKARLVDASEAAGTTLSDYIRSKVL